MYCFLYLLDQSQVVVMSQYIKYARRGKEGKTERLRYILPTFPIIYVNKWQWGFDVIP